MCGEGELKSPPPANTMDSVSSVNEPFYPSSNEFRLRKARYLSALDKMPVIGMTKFGLSYRLR